MSLCRKRIVCETKSVRVQRKFGELLSIEFIIVMDYNVILSNYEYHLSNHTGQNKSGWEGGGAAATMLPLVLHHFQTINFSPPKLYS